MTYDVKHSMKPADLLQARLEAGIARGIPGLSAAVVRGGELVWTGVAGLADVQGAQPVTAPMPFGIGSITKPFVAVIALQLVAEKRLRLDDSLATLLGPAVQHIANAGSATVAHLLGHRSGIPSWEFVPAWIRDGRGAALDTTRLWGKTDTLRYIFDAPAVAPAGEAADYSNTNYTLLGLIIEKITGNDLVDELRARILDPLGLGNTFLEGFEPATPGPTPRRYHWATETFRKDAGIHPSFSEVRPGLIDVSASNLSVEWAAGGMVASAADLARFGAALRNGKLLDPQGMARMQQWDARIIERDFGLGIYRDCWPDGTTLIGHDGGVLGFTATLFWIAGTDLTVAALSNVGKMHSGAVPASLHDVTRQRDFLDAVQMLQ